MTIKEFLAKFWAEQKAVILGLVVAFLTLLYGSFFAGQQNPPPEVVIQEVAENPALLELAARVRTPTPTAQKPGATSTPGSTATKPPATATKTVVANTPIPLTTTPGGAATNTPAPVTPTSPPVSGVCPEFDNHWKMPANVPCEHWTRGDNPRRADIVAIFDKYGTPGEYLRWLDDYGEMAQTWVSSANEIKSHGHGFKWVFTFDPTCEQFGGGAKDFTNVNCIIYSMDRIHDDGSAKHSVSARHSLAAHRVTCDKGADRLWQPSDLMVATCGVVRAGSSQADVDQLQTPYKKVFCNLPGDNPLWTALHIPDVLNGGVYHSMQIQLPSDDPITTGWWFQTPEQVEKVDYPYGPNQMFQTTFISQAWQLFQTYVCQWEANPSLATAAGYDLTTMTVLDAIKAETDKWPIETAANGAGNNLIQILNLGVQAFTKVGSGWTDPNGHIYPMGEPDGGCTEASYFCIPYSVEGNYPLGKEARLARRFPGNNILECDNAPCIIFPTNGVTLLPPILDVP